MSVVVTQVTTDNSHIKLFKQEANRVILYTDINTLSGTALDGSLLKAVILAARAMMNEFSTNDLYFGFQVTAWDDETITVGPGFVLRADAIYYFEGLTLTPGSAAFWGFYELEFGQESSDIQGRDFVDPLNETIDNASSPTRTRFFLNLYEKYNVTAVMPNLTIGRVALLEYTKEASLQPIDSVTPKLRSNQVLRGTVQIVNDADAPLSSIYGEQIRGKYEVFLESNELIEATLYFDGTNFRFVSTSPLASGTKDTAGRLNIYVDNDGIIQFQNKLGSTIKVICWRKF